MTEGKFNKLEEEYFDKKKELGAAGKVLAKDLTTLRASTKNKIRIAYITSRIKELPSIIRKALAEEIEAKDVFGRFTDLLGFRIVVNNYSDKVELLKELNKITNLEITESREHKDEKGYRATHLIANYIYEEKKKIVCELQVRTLLEDAWATLSHQDVYRNQSFLPPLARSISENLSRLLNAMDIMADEFRDRIKENVIVPNDLSPDASLDKQGIAFLFYRTFGEKLDEYNVQYIHNMAEINQIEKISDAEQGLVKNVFDELNSIHRKWFEREADNISLFIYGLKYVAIGDKAYIEFDQDVEQEWYEYDIQSMVYGSFPESFEEFVEVLKSHEIDHFVLHALSEMGAFGHCTRCGTQILKPYDASEVFLNYYKNPDTDEDLEEIFRNMSDEDDSIEIEDIEIPGVCSYCAHIMNKDD